MNKKVELGYFNDEKGEYVITNMYPKRPLINYAWNELIFANFDQFGCGKCKTTDSGVLRAVDEGVRLVYIKDRETGTFYSPNRNFKREPFDEFYCRVGQGYQTVVGEYQGLRTEFTITIPKEDRACAYRIKLTEREGKERKLSLYFLLEPQANITNDLAYGFGDMDGRKGLYYPHSAYFDEGDQRYEYQHLYFASERAFRSFAVSRTQFCGEYGNFADPDAIKAKKLPPKGTTFEDFYVAAVEIPVRLKAGQSKTYTFALAAGKSLEESREVAIRNARTVRVGKELQRLRRESVAQSNIFRAEVPDPLVRSLTNIWLKRQLALGKTWGRVYGKGFRDVMQDIAAFVSLDVELAKARILKALSKQYRSGNPIRMFEPDYTAPYNDGASWIPATVSAYIKESGDFSILDIVVPYLDGGEDTVYRHVLKGMEYLLGDTGERGLVLFRRGDWNDSLNGVGNLNRGESVWLSIATVKAAKEFAELAIRAGYSEDGERIARGGKILETRILTHGLKDGYFIYGIDDWGGLIGAQSSTEGKFYMNPQSWATLAEIGDERLRERAMDEVEQRLKCDFGYKLSDPPYTEGSQRLGRTSYFVPGMVENAAVYIHGVMFKLAADCKLKRSEKAYATLQSVIYNNPAVQRSGVEPYVISNMYIGPDNPYRAGDAPMSWVTGSGGWMYRNITEGIFGVRADYDGLVVDPCLPAAWKNAKVERLCRGVQYCIAYCNTGKRRLLVDGVVYEGNLLPYAVNKKKVNVIVEY